MKVASTSIVAATLCACVAATVIDAQSRRLSPGIVDVHSHNGTYT